ncbi:hypothetical protein L218DRAFT_951664 [Marasmius fiardii PR-910]|nr:hypothetical protein L218DRAFT_951664 [Marasmius fiardii PR-910]
MSKPVSGSGTLKESFEYPALKLTNTTSTSFTMGDTPPAGNSLSSINPDSDESTLSIGPPSSGSGPDFSFRSDNDSEPDDPGPADAVINGGAPPMANQFSEEESSRVPEDSAEGGGGGGGGGGNGGGGSGIGMGGTDEDDDTDEETLDAEIGIPE